MPSRRSVFATAAAGFLLAQDGGLIRSLRANPLGPWEAAPASAHADVRLRAAGWAVLAPNPHNRQPWLMRLEGDESVTLFCDLDRRLPVTDPFDRQIVIGLGAFLELFRLAALEQGFEARITPFPEGEPMPRLDRRPIARVELRQGGTPDPLFAAAPRRRSAKLPYDVSRAVDPAAIAALRGALLRSAGFGGASGDVAALRDLTYRAWTIESETRLAWMESVELMRLGSAAVDAQPDGISLWGQPFDGMIAAGQLTHAAMEPGQPGWQMAMQQYRAVFAATNAFVWLTTPGTSRAEQLAAGQDWLRLNLAATLAGLALQPVSQALQEYPEMAPARAELARLIGAQGTPQMLGRLGHPLRAAPPTPRWAAESRIMRA
jgi:hypothetical protein